MKGLLRRARVYLEERQTGTHTDRQTDRQTELGFKASSHSLYKALGHNSFRERGVRVLEFHLGVLGHR